jgi:hypothetical protein
VTESFADLRRRSRMVNQENASSRFASGGAVPDRTKSKTVVTTGKAAEREMEAMEKRVGAAKPQRKAGGGPVTLQTPPPMPMFSPNIPNAAALRASTTPMPLKKATLPMPLKSLDPYASGAKRGGRQKGRR